jgi:hypothetical protein
VNKPDLPTKVYANGSKLFLQCLTMADSTENCEQNLTIKVFDTRQKVSGVLATNDEINTPEQGTTIT